LGIKKGVNLVSPQQERTEDEEVFKVERRGGQPRKKQRRGEGRVAKLCRKIQNLALLPQKNGVDLKSRGGGEDKKDWGKKKG